jgi:signal transduction histidine kinase
MVGAVLAVLGLAYLDLSRDQRRALADFSAEQQQLASMLAHALDGVPADVPSLAAAVHRLAGNGTGELPRTRYLAARAGDNRSDRRSDNWIDVTGEVPQPLAPEPGLWRALQAVAGGGQGAIALSREDADRVGLGQRMAVAGYAGFRTADGGRWSIVVVASARRVRDRARISSYRLAAATALASVLVGAFGLIAMRQQRRALELVEQLRLAAATAALHERLIRAEKLSTIGTLAAGVAHEIGTPLGIISGRAEQLLARAPEGDAMRKGLSSIMGQVDKVSATIRQLLDFARVRPVEATAVTPIHALESARALLEHRFVKAKVSCELDAPATLPAVSADPGQLEQVLVNLLMNAVDACDAGGHVRARAESRGDRVSFLITDDGCGIAAEQLGQVLDPFFTTKKRGQGTGLGLTVAADIIKNHGGQIEIDSAPGQGTTVRFSLERAERPA